jgi:hypothetical protein
MYPSPIILNLIVSRRIKWMRGGKGNTYKCFVPNLEGKRPLGRFRRRLEYNIEMDVKEIRREGVERINLSQNKHQWRALVNTVMNLQVP